MIHWKRFSCGFLLAFTVIANAQDSEAVIDAAVKVWEHEYMLSMMGQRCMEQMPERKPQIQQLAQQWQNRNRDILVKTHKLFDFMTAREPKFVDMLKKMSLEAMEITLTKDRIEGVCEGFMHAQANESYDVKNKYKKQYEILMAEVFKF